MGREGCGIWVGRGQEWGMGSSGTVGFGELGGFEEGRGWGGVERKKRERRKRRDRRKWRRHEVGTVMVVGLDRNAGELGGSVSARKAKGGGGGAAWARNDAPSSAVVQATTRRTLDSRKGCLNQAPRRGSWVSTRALCGVDSRLRRCRLREEKSSGRGAGRPEVFSRP